MDAVLIPLTRLFFGFFLIFELVEFSWTSHKQEVLLEPGSQARIVLQISLLNGSLLRLYGNGLFL